MYRVKAVCSDEWEFVEAVRKYPMLVEVVDKPSGIYIFFDGRWKVARWERMDTPDTGEHSPTYTARYITHGKGSLTATLFSFKR